MPYLNVLNKYYIYINRRKMSLPARLSVYHIARIGKGQIGPLNIDAIFSRDVSGNFEVLFLKFI